MCRIGRSGGTGRRAGLKIPSWQQGVGSTPTSGSIFRVMRRAHRVLRRRRKTKMVFDARNYAIILKATLCMLIQRSDRAL